MDYSKRYPITQLRGEFILLSWTKAYRSVTAEYNGELLFENKTSADLKKGISVHHPELGEVTCKFAKEKMVLNVLVDGLHSPINKDHPINRVKTFPTFIWIIFAGTCITFIAELLSAIKIPYLLVILFGPVFCGLAAAVYCVAAIHLKKGKSWAFWLAFGLFSLRLILLVYLYISGVLSANGLGIFISLLLRFSFLLSFLLAIPHVLNYMKHEKYRKHENGNDELLDVKI